jgi:hypothetical protein
MLAAIFGGNASRMRRLYHSAPGFSFTLKLKRQRSFCRRFQSRTKRDKLAARGYFGGHGELGETKSASGLGRAFDNSLDLAQEDFYVLGPGCLVHEDASREATRRLERDS